VCWPPGEEALYAFSLCRSHGWKFDELLPWLETVSQVFWNKLEHFQDGVFGIEGGIGVAGWGWKDLRWKWKAYSFTCLI